MIQDSRFKIHTYVRDNICVQSLALIENQMYRPIILPMMKINNPAFNGQN